ncbi:MAG TPA: RNA-directed DNA polymerase [Candidatus Hydrogenedentes bacterium]|nr:RNA-directed DNA polymerase [Candidatus Hydrogenedentota bacterium]
MKRFGNLMEQIADRDNLLLAFWKAQRGKRAQTDTIRFRAHLEGELARLRSALLAGPLDLGPYRSFTVHDPKERVICAAPFADRVLHHAMMNVCHASFEAYQIYDSYACRVGKGTHKAVERAREFAVRYRHYLKLDIGRYFDSIDHELLKRQMRRRFKDRRVIEILDVLIDSYETAPGKGLPIGNLTSQYFANHYLGVLDHFVKETLCCLAYVRYMDDFVLWHDDRGQLKMWRDRIAGYLEETLRLVIKPDCLNRCDAGMTFLGYRLFPAAVTLARRSRIRFRRKLTAAHYKYLSGEWSEAEAARHVEPLIAFVRHGRSEAMRRRIIARL